MTRSARDALGNILTQLYPGLLLDDIHHGLTDADEIRAKLAEEEFRIVKVSSARNAAEALTNILTDSDEDVCFGTHREVADLILAKLAEEEMTITPAGVVKILRELVRLKDYKDEHGKDGAYQIRQPEAWNAVRAMLAAIDGEGK